MTDNPQSFNARLNVLSIHTISSLTYASVYAFHIGERMMVYAITNRLKNLYAMLYVVTAEGPQNCVMKMLAAPKIIKQLVICMTKNPNPLPTILFPIFLSKYFVEGLNSGCFLNSGIRIYILCWPNSYKRGVLSYFPTLDTSCLAGEVDAELDNYSLVHSERGGIVLGFYLLQCFFCTTVHFTFYDVDVAGC